MTTRDENLSLFSDLHKDLYGCRPGSYSMADFAAQSPAEQAAELDRLAARLRAELDREAAERAEFAEKVRALGLDPAKYLDRCWDYWEARD